MTTTTQLESMSDSNNSPAAHVCRGGKLFGQFAHPRGWLGSLVGRLMARKNAPMSHFAVELLEIQPADRILEIGCGPGVALQVATKRATSGLVVGVDHSELMIQQAAARNDRQIRSGRLELHRSGVSSLPFPDESFDKVFAVNSYHIWPAPETDLAEVRRVLRPGGTLLLCLRKALAKSRKWSAPGLTDEQVDAMGRLLQRLEWHDVRREHRNVGRDAVCVLAHR